MRLLREHGLKVTNDSPIDIAFRYAPSNSVDTDYLYTLYEQLQSEGKEAGNINYIFCDDEYLHKINVEYLQHDTLTDIITFDYTEGKVLHSDIYISVDRVKENAEIFKVPFQRELLRVLAHGLLHLCGYKDKTPKDSALMRQKEEEMMLLFDQL